MSKERLTTDHFTARCIARELGWGTHRVEKTDPMRERILNPSVNDPLNKQELSWKEHAQKDASTPHEVYWVREHGGGKSLWQHYNENLVFKRGIPKREA